MSEPNILKRVLGVVFAAALTAMSIGAMICMRAAMFI
jgi:hypothetical protein